MEAVVCNLLMLKKLYKFNKENSEIKDYALC